MFDYIKQWYQRKFSDQRGYLIPVTGGDRR